jgi:hypothetical protein
MKKINKEFRLIGFYYNANKIIIQNDITRIDINIWGYNYYAFITGRKTGLKKRYIKSSTENTIPEQYKNIIDNYLVMYKLTL